MITTQLSRHRLDQSIMSASCHLLTKTCLNLAAQCFLITRSVTVKFACLDVLRYDLACVAGGIVGAREIKFWRRSREENGEGGFEIPPARKPWVFE